MQSPSEWQITVLQGLKAHFKQPQGTSKPGTDWAVAVRNGAQEYRILVRAFAEDVGDCGQDGEVAIVIQFVAGLLNQGWTPDRWTGQPGELTVSPSQAEHESAAGPTKPWWRFW
jgi:hypothetical protein